MHDPHLDRVSSWIREYGKQLLPVARSFAVDQDDAEDILQEAWIIAHDKGHTVRERKAVRSWLYQVVMNIGRARARKRRRRQSLVSRFLHTGTRPEGPITFEEEQRRHHMWKAIADLPDLQKRVVLLRVVEGMSTKQAAEAIDRAEGTVKGSLHRALLRLRREMESSGPEQAPERSEDQ